MKTNCFLGIDTSNYTTSVALCTETGEVIVNGKAPLPVKAGERGLRQSDAVFAHIKNLPSLMASMRSVLDGCEIRAVGCSATPRDEEGSYMPCFLAGMAAAESAASVLGVPLYRFSHQGGHVKAALYSSGADGRVDIKPFVVFHVSGGTTEMLYVTPTETRYDVRLIGGSEDLHAGQAVDRIGVSLGLSFPAGPAMEALALENRKPIPPRRICVREGACSLSGLENLAAKLYRDTEDRALVCDYVFHFLGETLAAMVAHARAKYPESPVVFAGGVMSNSIVKRILAEGLSSVYFAEPVFSADNAAGIALLARRAYFAKKGKERA